MPNNPNNYPVTEYLGKRHIIGLGLLEWRSKWFGMQWLNFEFGVNNTCTTNDSVQLTRFMRGGANETDNHNSGIIEATAKEMWFAYRPAIKFYIPLSKHCAAEPVRRCIGGRYAPMEPYQNGLLYRPEHPAG